MKRIKEVNITFMVCALMPIIVGELLYLLNIRITSSTVGVLVSQAIYVLPVMIYLLMCRLNPLEALRIRKIKISNIFLLILFSFLIMPFVQLISAISLLFSDNEIASTVQGIATENSLGITILTVAVLPAILEESVYRGVLYNQYRKANPRIAIVLSALLFGLLHQNLNQFCYAFLLGMIFSLVIEATDSILSTMIVHFVINGYSTIMNYLYPKLVELLERVYGSDAVSVVEESATSGIDRIMLIQMIQGYLLPAAITGVLAFLVYRTIARNENRYDAVKEIFTHKQGHAKLSDFISIPLIIGAGICIYNIIFNLL